MKTFLYSFLVFLSSFPLIAETYIVPVHGTVGDPQLRWVAAVFVTNPHELPVTMRIDAVYPQAGLPSCGGEGQQVVIPPHSTVSLSVTGSCDGNVNRLQAVQFTTTRSVIPVLDVTSHRGHTEAPQSVPIERSWLPAGTDVAITRVVLQPPERRANLFFVNPNSSALSVEYRKLNDPGARVFRLEVPPESLFVHPLEGEEFFCSDAFVIPFPPDFTCGIQVRADAQFYVGASIIWNDSSDAVYRPPFIVEP